jgi:hypothetical protein
VLSAYGHLWDLIDTNGAQLNSEVWSWKYESGTGFVYVPLGAYVPTESNIRQLWSLAFLSMRRESFAAQAPRPF